MIMTKGYHDLLIWQVGMDLVEWMYKISDGFPTHERFGLTSQMRRATVSIPSNIAKRVIEEKQMLIFSNFYILHLALPRNSKRR